MAKVKVSVYLINLKRSPERRQKMECELAKLGIPFCLHEATDGIDSWSDLVAMLNEQEFSSNVGRAVLPGEVGCYHSHISVWREFSKTESDIALILEDDVVFHDDFIDGLSVAIMMRDKWDFLKLNKIRAKQPLTQFTLGKWKLNSYLGPATGLGAYMIKKKLADRLSKEISIITRPIDHELDRVHVHKFRHMGLEPFPSHVDDGGKSTITGMKFEAVKKFKWYKRLPNYGLRVGNLIGKLIYLIKSEQFFSQRKEISDEGPRPRFCFK